MSAVRARAAAALGLPPEPTPQEAAAAFLGALTKAQFVPNCESVAAVNLLSGRSVPADPDAECGIGFAEEIEEFARNYWSLGANERRAAWTALGGRAIEDRFAARLLSLQAGLELETASQLDPAAEEIAVLSRELYVLTPRSRALRRNEWLLDNASRHAVLVRATNDLIAHTPAIANLDPVLFARLKPSFPAAEFAAAASAEILPEPDPGLSVSRQGAIEKTVPVVRSYRDEPSERTTVPGGVKWGAIFGVIMLIRIVVALVSSNSSSTPSPRGYDPPPVRTYQYQFKGEELPAIRQYSVEEVANFRMYESNHVGRIAPPGFSRWLKDGRPEAMQPVYRAPDSEPPP